jgi:hypothetical protein
VSWPTERFGFGGGQKRQFGNFLFGEPGRRHKVFFFLPPFLSGRQPGRLRLGTKPNATRTSRFTHGLTDLWLWLAAGDGRFGSRGLASDSFAAAATAGAWS